MKLYSYWRSSSSWRVRLALHHKGVPFETVPVHLVRDGGEQRRAEHRARNPMAQVPVLELEDGRRLSQSVAIIEYLEERHRSPQLLPDDPYDRAWVRQLVELVNSGIQPVQNLEVLQTVTALGADRGAWGRGFIERGLAALQELARLRAGQFLFGDRLSLADLFLVPQLYNARRFGCDLGDLDLLLAVEARCAALPAFERAHPDAQPDAPPPDQRTP